MKRHILIAILAMAAAALAQNSPPLPAAGNVALPLNEYDKLVQLAGQTPKTSAPPPVPYILKNAQIDLKVQGELASGSVLLDGEVFADGERKVPLVNGMVVLDARQDGRALPMEPGGNNVYAAVFPGPAEFSARLEAAVPLTIEAGRASFRLSAPAAGAVRLVLTVPGEQTQVNLNPGLITERSSGNGQTIVKATLAPGEIANVWWASRLSTPPVSVAPKPVRFLSDVKTLISVGEADLEVTALAEITVIQGEPAQFEIQAPQGYELTNVSGPTLLSSDSQEGTIMLKVIDPTARSHQFLVSLAKANTTSSAEIPLISFRGTQRETGEVLVEGDGAIELAATERGGLRRMDLKETSTYLRSLAHAALHTAFRYQKRPAETPTLALEWMRFPDSRILSAVAQSAIATTLVTNEGRTLTEVKLTLKNQAQPFLKVDLPAGASILSAEVAGEKVKPVQGADGSRVPLLRPGFRPMDAYTISFVFVHAGTPFEKKGGTELALPKIDIPVGKLEWEVFLPQQYKIARFGGDAIPARLFSSSSDGAGETLLPLIVSETAVFGTLLPGRVGGVVTDPAGAVVAGAPVTVTHVGSGITMHTLSDRRGNWTVSNLPPGPIQIVVNVPGFRPFSMQAYHDAARGSQFNQALEVGSTAETVTVTAVAPLLKTESGELSHTFVFGQPVGAGFEPRAPRPDPNQPMPASANVTDLQRRVAGVLPIAVNVPRSGNAYRFVRPLVIDDETRLTFVYKRASRP